MPTLRYTRRFLLLALFTFPVLVPNLPAQAQDWPTTSWEVACAEDLKQSLSTQEYVFECEDEVSGAARISKYELEQASSWLKDLGFYGPSIKVLSLRASADDAPRSFVHPVLEEVTRVQGMHYLAEISDEENRDEHGTLNYGVYTHDNELFLNSTHYIAIGRGDTEAQAESALSRGYAETATAAHELFHGIQRRYWRHHQDEEDSFFDPRNGWITEGTADAVLLTWIQKNEPDRQLRGFPRSYDYPLHEPKTEIVNGQNICYDCYYTSDFWRYNGGVLGSINLIQYFDRVLREDLSEHNGLVGVNRALERLQQEAGWRRPDGLYESYPRFIAHRANQPAFFEKTTDVRLSVQAQEQDTERLQQTVRKVAADAYEVTVDIPQGALAGFKVSFANDHEDLHLIVDQRRLDVPDVLSTTPDEQRQYLEEARDPGWERNVYRTSLTSGENQRFFARVANVGLFPEETTDRPYEIEFTLTKLDACESDRMWAAIDPSLRDRLQLLPPEQYQQQYPTHYVAAGELHIAGLVNDGGIICAHPLGSGLPPASTPAEAAERGAQLQQRAEAMQGMSREELMELGRRMAEQLGNQPGQGRTPEQYIQAALGAMEDADLEPIEDISTLISLFSPNALSWQRHQRSGVPSAASILDALTQDDPIVPYRHEGIGGWLGNSGVDASIIIPGVAPAELREGMTYEAHATVGYRRGEGKVVKTRRSVAGPTSPNYSPIWQAMEGWHEWLRPAPSTEPWMMSGTVTVEEITGASVRATFDLTGMGHWMRAECPRNRFNLLRIQRQCSDEERDGAVSITGRFEAPHTALHEEEIDD